MSEWWDIPAEVEAEPSKLPAKRQPEGLSETDLYRSPKKVTARWAEAQLSKSEWRDHAKTASKLTPQLMESMSLDASKGLSKRAIMARAGYHPVMWDRWVKKAEEGQEPYALWYRCMLISMSQVEESLLDTVRLHTATDWKAAKWMLEQINKDDYGPAPTTNATINVNGDVTNENSVNYLSQDDAVSVARILKGIGALPSEDVIEGEIVEEGN